MIKIISKRKFDYMNDKIDGLEFLIKELKEENKTIRDENDDLFLDNKQFKEDNENYFGQVNILNKDNKEKNKKIKELTEINRELGNQITVLTEENEKAVKNNQKLKKEIEELKKKSELKDKEIEELKKNVRTITYKRTSQNKIDSKIDVEPIQDLSKIMAKALKNKKDIVIKATEKPKKVEEVKDNEVKKEKNNRKKSK